MTLRTTSRLAAAFAVCLAAGCDLADPALDGELLEGNRPLPVAADFEGRIDPAAGAFHLDLAPPPLDVAASLQAAPVPVGANGVSLVTTNLSLVGTACGANTFEGDVTIKNDGAVALRNVYAEIVSMSLSGRESCTSDQVPRPASAAVSDANGLWAYGDIAAGASVTRRWQLRTPTSAGYTFKGRVVSAGERSSAGAGGGLGATLQAVSVDSDGASLFVTVKFAAPPAANALFLLVDDVARTSGMSGATALAYDPTGAVGALSAAGGTLENAVGADLDAYLVGGFTGGVLTPLHARTITGAAASTAAAGVLVTQDAAAGRYHWRIPYAALGGAAGDQVKVWVLYGQDNATGLGIHSAAPAPPAPQVTLMDSATGHGLTQLSPAPPSHTLFGTPAGGCPAPVSFAVIGDFGWSGPAEAAVASLVRGWQPDFVATTGDNDYDYDLQAPAGPDFTLDQNIGRYYAPFIGNYQGAFGPGSATNRFFPVLGNHDWVSRGRVDGQGYFDYFTLPGNERYYDFVAGEVHVFALDSDDHEPDGWWETSTQGLWLQNGLAASTSRWNVVLLHHVPYSSGANESAIMRWPFAAWGADAVIGGHDHLYERLSVGGIPYFVNGAGGDDLFAFPVGGTDPNSQVRYNASHGAQRVVADGKQLLFEFVTHDGTLVDTWRLAAPVPCGP